MRKGNSPNLFSLVTRNGGDQIAGEIPQSDGAFDGGGGHERVVELGIRTQRDRGHRPRMRPEPMRFK